MVQAADVSEASEPIDADVSEDSELLRVGWGGGPRESHLVSRFIFLRGMGLVYCIAFACLLFQFEALIGQDGLLPVTRYLDRIEPHTSFWDWPTVFWFGSSDAVLRAGAVLGLLLSVGVLAGIENGLVMCVLWLLYMSFVHVGQIFWGYGWEILLLEAGFLSVFLCPVRSVGPMRAASPPPLLVIWAFYWLCFRVMFGAGLIKLRGDDCWTDLTCLVHHYETQPIPNPLSPLLHAMPVWFHKGGVLCNHLVELLAPWMLLGPRRLRIVGALSIIAFQLVLILSGNLSFLNWLTIVVCLPCFDDRFWRGLLPRVPALVGRELEAPKARMVVTAVFALLVCVLSIGPVLNMLSPRQAMNTSFDPYHLVNSYGAFGSVGKVRHEVVLQGTESAAPSHDSDWKEYEFNCKPGDVHRRPCQVSPYHYRIDWQMWFAALGQPQEQVWLLNFVSKLLKAEPIALGLLAFDPFDGRRPKQVRAEFYRYEFAYGESGVHWKRERVAGYLPAMTVDDPRLRDFLRAHGF